MLAEYRNDWHHFLRSGKDGKMYYVCKVVNLDGKVCQRSYPASHAGLFQMHHFRHLSEMAMARGQQVQQCRAICGDLDQVSKNRASKAVRFDLEKQHVPPPPPSSSLGEREEGELIEAPRSSHLAGSAQPMTLTTSSTVASVPTPPASPLFSRKPTPAINRPQTSTPEERRVSPSPSSSAASAASGRKRDRSESADGATVDAEKYDEDFSTSFFFFFYLS